VPPREALVRAALAAYGAALLGGLVAAQYVDAELFALLTPAVVGAACGAAGQSASRVLRSPERGRGPLSRAVRAVACVAALLGVGLGFVLERSTDPVSSSALLPCATAVVACLLWTAPPRRRPEEPEAGPGS
jgi:hypothetical protein